MTSPFGGERIDLLVSDVDGTLVTDDKRLTAPTVEAAACLRAAGVKLSLVSSRPPIGFAPFRELALTGPLGAFNGGMLVDAEGQIVEQVLVPAHDAQVALQTFDAFALDAWLFTADTWFVRSLDGAYVEKERKTIVHAPVVVGDFEPLLEAVGKLVGSSRDVEAVARCEAALRDRLGPETAAARSQPYYLDVTPAASDKGAAVRRIAQLLGVEMAHVAVIGDMANDLPMFGVAAFRIAMGNGIDELKRSATFVTTSNQCDGFAAAVHDYVLPRAARASA